MSWHARTNIVITGFMGAGKTSVGREVARLLGCSFADTDAIIEQRVGMPIWEVFHTHGEEWFRAQERRVCRELADHRRWPSLPGLSRPPSAADPGSESPGAQTGQGSCGEPRLVIATGGGSLVCDENRQVLGRSGILICLTCDVEELLQRLQPVEDRPLLALGDRRRSMEGLLAERRGTYERIPCQVDTTRRTVEEVAQMVIQLCKSETKTETIAVTMPATRQRYEVHVGSRLLGRVGELARERGLGGTAVLVTNPTVSGCLGSEVIESLQGAGLSPRLVQVPDGEACKTLDTVRFLYERFADAALDRSSPLFALGGGAICDMAGFAAATYMRGLPVVHIPTTLLAMVDASVGGKVAVDHCRGKNLIGAFHQPELVVVDTDALNTLPQAEFRAGVAEAIKAGMIGSPRLFEHLEHHGVQPLPWVIAEAIRVKAVIVEQDPYDSGRRAILNLGHTFGHALELLSAFTMRHGEAVSVGMAMAVEVSVALGLCDVLVRERLIRTLRRYGLPTSYQGPAPGEVLAAMAADKKRKGGRLRFVLPTAIGQAVVSDDVPETLVLEVLERMRAG